MTVSASPRPRTTAELVDAVAAGEGFIDVTAKDGDPFLALEVVRDPHLDVPRGQPLDTATASRLRGQLRTRFDVLRRPFTERAEALLTYGTFMVEGPDGQADEANAAAAAAHVWGPVIDGVAEEVTDEPGRVLSYTEGLGPQPPTIFRVRAIDDDDPLAFVVILPLIPGEDTDATRLVRTLAMGAGKCCPVHVIGVATGDVLTEGGDRERLQLLRRCQQLRMSLVLHGGFGHDVVNATGTRLLRRERLGHPISLISCPQFKAGEGTPGLTRVRIDLAKGEAEIAFRYALGSDLEPAQPMQIVRPLVSASRISNAERRLHLKIMTLLDRARESATDAADVAEIDTFIAYAKSTWSRYGYAALCDADGHLPRALQPERRTRHNLLLLLRQRENGGYDILLSRHTPRRAPRIADWDALLLPAFELVRTLLDHLRSDVIRQATDGTGDLERGAHARSFEQVTAHILERGSEEDVWSEYLREVGMVSGRKLSPTDGVVTEYEYRLVVLQTLIQRREHGDNLETDDQRDAQRLQARLAELDAIVADPTADLAGNISIDTLLEHGAGLRWEPKHELLTDEPQADDRRRTEKIRPGAIWFPLDGPEGRTWRDCPAIRARNADVMTLLEAQLKRRRSESGVYLPELLLGRANAENDQYNTVERLAFEQTVAALRKVELGPGGDLKGTLIYAAHEILPVVLRREPYLVRDGARKVDAIMIYDAQGRAWQDLDEIFAGDPVGILRPVQRYVLISGLRRALDIDAQVLEPLRSDGDPWGYARVRKGIAPDPVAVTPAIIERVPVTDGDPALELPEYLLCDGNHRVVARVWQNGEAMAAVAVEGVPDQPFYAKPFGWHEWQATEDNRVALSPPPAWKHYGRPVPDLSPEAEAINRIELPEEQPYRRWFRNLETGFGPMGGQGGRFN